VRKLILAGLAAAGGAAWLAASPHAGFSGSRTVEIGLGTPTRVIARTLEEQGVVRSQYLFLLARAIRPSAVLKAGEYRFEKAASAIEVFDRLVRGDVHYHRLQVPEGSNIFDVARIAEESGLFRASEFLKAASDSSLVRDLDPAAKNLEGYLFPSTYRVTKQTTADQLCRMMTEQFRAVWKQVAPTGSPRPHEAVTLASLVEKETGAAHERPLVASVFRNRLNRAMPLQCDPTTIYAAMLDGRWRGKIYRSDLDHAHPYNTYRHAGLPPGPIASPGKAAIEAALAPPPSNFLYFVAKPGAAREHNFSATLSEHERAVAEYRNGASTNQAKPAPASTGRTQPGRS